MQSLAKYPMEGLVLLIGPPASGKSTFAKALIKQRMLDEESYISNDRIARELFDVTINRGDKDGEIFAEQDKRVASLLREHEVALVDATNVKPEARQRLIAIADEFGAPTTALCFRRDVPKLLSQNKGREVAMPERMMLEYAALMNQVTAKRLRQEGVRHVFEVAADN